MDDEWVDGNAVAGVLGTIFATDATSAVCACQGCGHVAALAETRVFLRGLPGVVVRCRPCDAVLMVIVERAGSRRVDLAGVRYLQFAT